MHPWLSENLVCPRDKQPLALRGSSLECSDRHSYRVINGVPVLLIPEADKTQWVIGESLKATATDGPWFPATLDLTPEKMSRIPGFDESRVAVDPVVSHLIVGTNGYAYRHLLGKLEEYPIPEIRLPPGNGRLMLDVGCGWGRWSVAAHNLDYRPVGIDPCLGAVMAARRVTKQFGQDVPFVCGDARFLPFRDRQFDAVFSNGVIQHFGRENARKAVREIGRVLACGGTSLVQMAHKWGVRAIYHQLRRGFFDGKDFDVRYWKIADLERLFAEVGASDISVDCFFGLGLQKSDLRLMPPSNKAAIHISEALRAASTILPALRYAADSVYIKSRKVRNSIVG